MTNHTAIVVGVKAMLEARGQRFTTNEDSFEITGRVAWALRHEGALLIRKAPAQNGAVYHGVKYSHDAIAFPTGWIDCLKSAGPPVNLNEPTWGPTGESLAELVAPFDLDAGMVPPAVVDPPVIVEPPPLEVAAILQELAALRGELRQLLDVMTLDRAVILGGMEQLYAQSQRGWAVTWYGSTIKVKPVPADPPKPPIARAD